MYNVNIISYTLEHIIKIIPLYVYYKIYHNISYFQMKTQLFHFTRIPGCAKIKDLEKCKNFLPTGKLSFSSFFYSHYQYLEETRPIRHKTLVILIPCNNCNEHKIDPENCEFILDSENRIFGISFKITERKSETHYMVRNDFLGSIRNHIVYSWQPFFYYNKEKFFQTYEISKEFDFNYITPFNNKRPILFYPSDRAPKNQKAAYLSIFCPVSSKEIQLSFKNIYEKTTTIKYGWTMFSICSDDFMDLSQWSICTTHKPNEITLVSCNKPKFNMYILNNNREPMSLLNLSLSSLYQNKLNSALNLTKYAVPKTLSQQAPPCYLFHINSRDLSIEYHGRCNCCGYFISSHISNW